MDLALPPNEPDRLRALREYGILDTAPEQSFDDLTALAAHLCEAPIALISLLDENRQWFKSRIGITATETARDISFCTHAILEPDLFIVPDACKDARFAENPLVTSDPHIRFYAGSPLVTPTGYALGTLCVIDHVPRELRPEQRQALAVLSRHVIAQLELRRALAARQQAEEALTERNEEVRKLRRALDGRHQFADLLGKSTMMQRIFQLIREVSRVDATVLIEGETGTGKELVARAIHAHSHRSAGPFITVNCAGLTESLVGSQLFGHRKGAFTGAVETQQGLFEAANGGTLFLDEIGDVPLSIQTSLLRVLQEREVTRLGESKPRKVDVRVLAATHHDLAHDAEQGSFRPDLLYRIRVARLPLPPLRARREDIPLLAGAFLEQCRTTTGTPVETIAPEAMACLVEYSWPGNVRELKSAIEYAVIHSHPPSINKSDLPPEITQLAQAGASPVSTEGSEKNRILVALQRTQGNRKEAAKILGMSRATFYRHLAQLGISPPR